MKHSQVPRRHVSRWKCRGISGKGCVNYPRDLRSQLTLKQTFNMQTTGDQWTHKMKFEVNIIRYPLMRNQLIFINCQIGLTWCVGDGICVEQRRAKLPGRDGCSLGTGVIIMCARSKCHTHYLALLAFGLLGSAYASSALKPEIKICLRCRPNTFNEQPSPKEKASNLVGNIPACWM